MAAQIGVVAFELWNIIGFLALISTPVFWFLQSRPLWFHSSVVTAHLVVLLIVGHFAWIPPGWSEGNVYWFLLRNYGDFIVLAGDFFALSLKGGLFDLAPAITLILFASLCGAVSLKFTPIWLDAIPHAIVRAADRQANGRHYCITLSGNRPARSISDLTVGNLTSGLGGVEYHAAYAQLDLRSGDSLVSSLWSFRSLDFVRLAPSSAKFFPPRCAPGDDTGIRVEPDTTVKARTAQ